MTQQRLLAARKFGSLMAANVLGRFPARAALAATPLGSGRFVRVGERTVGVGVVENRDVWTPSTGLRTLNAQVCAALPCML